MTSTRRMVVRSSVMLAGLTALSQLLGFTRDAVMAAVLGASSSVDAYLVAQGLMNLVLGLIAGAMARALVPTVARSVEDGVPERGHRTVRVALTVTLTVLTAGSVVMFVAAPWVVAVLAPGFTADTAAEAVRLTRIVLVATVFVSGTNLLAGAANAHRRFFWSGLQGIPFNVVMIAAVALFGAAHDGVALAVGFVVGSAVRLVLQLPAVRAIGLRLRPSLRLRDDGFREVLRLVPPLLVGSAIVNVNTMVDRAVGSAQGDGTIASLGYGWRIVTLAEVVMITALTTTLFPAFSTLGTPERRAELRRATGRVLDLVLVLIVPVVVVLAVAARPIVVVLFARGSFDARAVELTAVAVTMYAAALAGLAVREVVARVCLAVGDSRTPVLTALTAMVVNVVGDLTLGMRFGVAGLAVSTSFSVITAATLLSVLTARRHQALALAGAGRTLAAVLGAGGVAGLVGWFGVQALPMETTLEALVALGVGGTLCTGTYLGVLLMLRLPVLGELRASLRELVRR